MFDNGHWKCNIYVMKINITNKNSEIIDNLNNKQFNKKENILSFEYLCDSGIIKLSNNQFLLLFIYSKYSFLIGDTNRVLFWHKTLICIQFSIVCLCTT